MANDAVAFIRALGLDQIDLLGFSMGGFVAQVIAEQHPDLVRKVILAGTGPAGGEGTTHHSSRKRWTSSLPRSHPASINPLDTMTRDGEFKRLVKRKPPRARPRHGGRRHRGRRRRP
jgi:pimeloyl-ACP methyl ester carboxylesterase